MSLNALKVHLATLPRVSSANALAKKFNLDPTTVNRSLRRLGYKYVDGIWYSPKQTPEANPARQSFTFTLTVEEMRYLHANTEASDIGKLALAAPAIRDWLAITRLALVQVALQDPKRHEWDLGVSAGPMPVRPTLVDVQDGES